MYNNVRAVKDLRLIFVRVGSEREFSGFQTVRFQMEAGTALLKSPFVMKGHSP